MPTLNQVDNAGSAMQLMSAIVLVCMLAAIPLFTVINAWLVDKSLDTGVAVTIVLIIGLLVMAMMKVWAQPLMYAILALMLGLNFALPALGTVAGKRAEQQMTSDDIEKYERVIARDPKNAAAHGFLGDAYMKVDRFEDAAKQFQTAVELDPQHSTNEKYKLQRALEKVTGQTRELEMCPGCHAEHAAGHIKCPDCGHYMKSAYFLQALSKQAAPAGGVLLGGTVLSSVMPPPINGFVCLAALGAGGYLLWSKMKEE